MRFCAKSNLESPAPRERLDHRRASGGAEAVSRQVEAAQLLERHQVPQRLSTGIVDVVAGEVDSREASQPSELAYYA